MHTAIVGCGGSGGWFCQLLAKSDMTDKNITLIDGDTWSKSNLTRQFCTRRDIGRAKVDKFNDLLRGNGASVLSFAEYIKTGSDSYNLLSNNPDSLCTYVAVDNHPARKVCYKLADERFEKNPQLQDVVISVANEYETASAWVYLPRWKDTSLDPRIRWPEILSNTEGDPLTPSCTGAALESSPQLALSNMLSASAGAWLYRFWTEIAPKFQVTMQEGGMPEEQYQALVKTFPVWVDFTNGRNKTYTIGDLTHD